MNQVQIGDRFHKLTVVSRQGSDRSRRILWLCICDCGKQTVVAGVMMRNGNTKSCGCLRIDNLKESLTTHGACLTKEYKCWSGIKSRCKDTKNKYYQGRGIKMCERWMNSFENFLEDMGYAPAPNFSIERNDVNGDYCKENCTWATTKAQSLNKRSSLILNYNGKILPLKEVAKLSGINPSTIKTRLHRGRVVGGITKSDITTYYQNKKLFFHNYNQ